MSRQILLDAPSVGASERKYLNRAINTGYVSTVGPFVGQFERRFEEFLSVKNAVSLQSGTAALHLALYALGIKKGDEVIVPALTFIATVNPVVYVGARPVFVDVDKDTWNIDPNEIKKNLSKRTKAVIIVHLYGNPCNMDEIMDIAKNHNLHIIEDATESLGAKFKNRFTGTFGKFGCFSFNGNKVITTGGGGAIVGRGHGEMKRIKYLANQARDSAAGYYHSEIGFNYRMTNLEAGMGLAQMESLGRFLLKKKKINNIYKKELSGIKNINFQSEYSSSINSHWLNCITYNGQGGIKKLQRVLAAKGIPTRRIFTPLIDLPPYNKYKKRSFPNSSFLYNNGLSLPSSVLNSEKDIHYVCKVIKKSIGGTKK